MRCRHNTMTDCSRLLIEIADFQFKGGQASNPSESDGSEVLPAFTNTVSEARKYLDKMVMEGRGNEFVIILHAEKGQNLMDIIGQARNFANSNP